LLELTGHYSAPFSFVVIRDVNWAHGVRQINGTSSARSALAMDSSVDECGSFKSCGMGAFV